MDANARKRRRQGAAERQGVHKKLFRKIFAYRIYISQEPFENIFVDDIHLVTKIKKNMKKSLMNIYDKILLNKRSLIEIVNDKLKNVCHIEYTKHRYIENFALNLTAGLTAYNLLPQKVIFKY